MKPFMGNPCGHGYCKCTECDNCYHYTPTCFGIKVPKWLGNALFKLEEWLMWRCIKKGGSK